MRSFRWTLLAVTAVLAIAAALLLQPTAAAGEEAEIDGKTLFVETHKCNMCHAVPAAEIEAKMKSEKMKGPDLGGKIDVDFAEIAAFVRKAGQLKGEEHNKEFKGSDEELQTILDWLGSLEAQE